jgi:hypothetical protein
MDGADLAQPYGVRLRRVQELQAYVESSFVKLRLHGYRPRMT